MILSPRFHLTSFTLKCCAVHSAANLPTTVRCKKYAEKYTVKSTVYQLYLQYIAGLLCMFF